MQSDDSIMAGAEAIAENVARHGEEWLARLFATIDRRDAQGFAEFLAEDCLFRFGNAAPAVGRTAIRQTTETFFASLADIKHSIEATIRAGERIACHGQVVYERPDGGVYRTPFANFFALKDGLIAEYLIFVDLSGLYESPK